MPATGGLAGQSAYVEAYGMVAYDLRKALESIEKERYQRDSRYMDQTKDTLLVGPSLSSVDFGFFGDRHPLSGRQMTSAKKFFAHLDTLRSTMLQGIGDLDLKSKQPALWLDMVQTLNKIDTFVQSLLVQLHGHGGTERSHVPLVVQSDIYGSSTNLEHEPQAGEGFIEAGATPG